MGTSFFAEYLKKASPVTKSRWHSTSLLPENLHPAWAPDILFGSFDPLKEIEGVTSRDRYMFLEYYYSYRGGRELSEYVKKWMFEIHTAATKVVYGQNYFTTRGPDFLKEAIKRVILPEDGYLNNGHYFWTYTGAYDTWQQAHNAYRDKGREAPEFVAAMKQLRAWAIEDIARRFN